jgi:hypothetical protein
MARACRQASRAASGTADAAVHLAELGEGAGFAVAVAKLPEEVDGGLEQVQGLLRVVDGVGVTALLPVHEVATVVGPGLPGGVVDRSRQLEGAAEMEMRVVVAAQVGVSEAEVAVRPGLGAAVAELPRGVQGGVVGGGPVLPVPLPVEEDVQRPGQLAGVAVVPVAGGLLDGREQHAVLGGEPGHRQVGAGPG